MSFRPAVAPTMAAAALAALFLSLGSWQLQRSAAKQERIERHASAPHRVGLPPADAAGEFIHTTLRGAFDTRRHVLADNQVLNGRAGVHVYTPFRLPGGESVLVNRGWLPLAPDRRELPEISTPGEAIEISGRLGPIPASGRQLGPTDDVEPERWPQLLTYPDLARISGALGSELFPLVLFLDPESPGGFEGRDWPPVFLTPTRHRAYAFQWFALAAAILAAWFLLGLRGGTGE